MKGKTSFRFFKKTVTLGTFRPIMNPDFQTFETTLSIDGVYSLAHQISVDFWDTKLPRKQKM